MQWNGRKRWIVAAAAALMVAGCSSSPPSASSSAAPSSVSTGDGKSTWLLDHGQWVLVSSAQSRPALPARPQPNSLLDRTDQLLKQQQPAQAHDLLVPWLVHHQDAPDRDRALYLAAQVFYQLGDRQWAFYYLDELMDEYPESRLFYTALGLQYQIADSYLNGYKEKFLGMPIVSREDEGLEMLFRIQERSPGSPLAEKALLRTANYYFSSSQFDLASDAYLAYIRSYPTSPALAHVKLRRAFAAQAQFRGLAYDTTPLVDAQVQFQRIVREYPALARAENVQSFIDGIDQTLARKLALRADFYLRTHEPRAAAWTLNSLVNQYPGTPESSRARIQLAAMDPSLLAAPASPGPTTLPVHPAPTIDSSGAN